MLAYPAEPARVTGRVLHAWRIEALCHAELGRYRRRVYCHGCLKQHIEWFEVSINIVIVLIVRWIAWMEGKPDNNDMKLGRSWGRALKDRRVF